MNITVNWRHPQILQFHTALGAAPRYGLLRLRFNDDIKAPSPIFPVTRRNLGKTPQIPSFILLFIIELAMEWENPFSDTYRSLLLVFEWQNRDSICFFEIVGQN